MIYTVAQKDVYVLIYFYSEYTNVTKIQELMADQWSKVFAYYFLLPISLQFSYVIIKYML